MRLPWSVHMSCGFAPIAGTVLDPMNEAKATLIMSHYVKGEPISYVCSLCGKQFLLPEDRSPKEGATELLAAFSDHVKKRHSDPPIE